VIPLRRDASLFPAVHAPPGWLRILAGAWSSTGVLPPWPRLPVALRAHPPVFGAWIGLVLVALQALLWGGHRPLWPPAEARVALVLAPGLLAHAAALHVDGVMDTADGLAAGERSHEAMDAARVGASGGAGLTLLLLAASRRPAEPGGGRPLRSGAGVDLVSGLGTDGAAAWRFGAFPYPCARTARWPSIAATGSVNRPGVASFVTALAALALQGQGPLGRLVLARAGWGCCGAAGAALLGPATGRPTAATSSWACVEWNRQPALLLMALVISAGWLDLRQAWVRRHPSPGRSRKQTAWGADPAAAHHPSAASCLAKGQAHPPFPESPPTGPPADPRSKIAPLASLRLIAGPPSQTVETEPGLAWPGRSG